MKTTLNSFESIPREKYERKSRMGMDKGIKKKTFKTYIKTRKLKDVISINLL